MKEFELKEDEIFDLADKGERVILKSDDCRYYELVPVNQLSRNPMDDFQSDFVTIEIELPVFVLEALEEMAQENGVTLEEFVTKALEDRVNELENK